MSTVDWSSSVWIFGGWERFFFVWTYFGKPNLLFWTQEALGGLSQAWEELEATVLCVPWMRLCTAHLRNLWTQVLLLFLLPGLFGFDLTNYKVALQLNPWVTSRKGQTGAGLYISPHIPVWEMQHGEWVWTWARRLPGFRASLCHWLWLGDVTLCLCFLNRNVGITVEPPLQNCEDWMR